MLVQLDRLVHLLETPAFTFLRLQLLRPQQHPFLLRCMYAILMLLPQSSAFKILHTRLNSVPTLALLQLEGVPHSAAEHGNEWAEFEHLLTMFRTRQEQHIEQEDRSRAEGFSASRVKVQTTLGEDSQSLVGNCAVVIPAVVAPAAAQAEQTKDAA